jgi:hypothetical protein
MITTARKYRLHFTALSVSQDVTLQMPIWKHPAVRKSDYDLACRCQAAACLQSKHNVRSVEDVLTIAARRTTVQ